MPKVYKTRATSFGRIRVNDKYPYRILFLFSDAYSIDDPRPAVKRLCEAGIVLILIGIGRVNIRGQEDLVAFCGLGFGIDIPVPEVIEKIKVRQLRLENKTI